MRGAVRDDARAFHDAHAVAVLHQRIRAAGARRRQAYHAAEERALEAIGSRIGTLSDGARGALADGART